MDRQYQAALRYIPGIGNSRLTALIMYFGSGRAAWEAAEEEVRAAGIFDSETCNKFVNGREKLDINQLATRWQQTGIKIMTRECEDYPEQLRNIYDAPQVLFYKGKLPAHINLIAIVGARKASAYGKNAARMLANDLARAGCCVVSGAARGIDTAAHEGALATGTTVAVVGSGLAVCYPPENRNLLERIAEAGAVISEYPHDTPPLQGYFPARNRIINGLSRGVVVVEAAEKSGALITADYALEEGRDVFAVPGSVFSNTSTGCHRLIKQGAKLVETAQDILEEYCGLFQTSVKETVCNEEEAGILHLLTFENPLSLEEIAIKSRLAVPELTYILLQLELKGIVAQQSGQRYIRMAGRNLD